LQFVPIEVTTLKYLGLFVVVTVLCLVVLFSMIRNGRTDRVTEAASTSAGPQAESEHLSVLLQRDSRSEGDSGADRSNAVSRDLPDSYAPTTSKAGTDNNDVYAKMDRRQLEDALRGLRGEYSEIAHSILMSKLDRGETEEQNVHKDEPVQMHSGTVTPSSFHATFTANPTGFHVRKAEVQCEEDARLMAIEKNIELVRQYLTLRPK
jgi:hypothetical protein